jgi:peptidoglycan/xylan/chitin deacetylase (PgdA/CDA1 family)
MSAIVAEEDVMSVFGMRTLAASVVLGVAGVLTAAGPAGASTPASAATLPGPQFYAPGSGKTVALTFDDGPGPSTQAIINILRAYGVPATFFNLGQNAAARQALVKEEAKDGFVVGNHTWSHPVMTALSARSQASQMDRASSEQHLLTGHYPVVFRPPYGDYSTVTLALAAQRGMRVWLWSVDTEDWKAAGSASTYWVNRIISLAEREGGVLNHPVVLMHNAPSGDPATVKALPAIIKYFRGHGYRFVAL